MLILFLFLLLSVSGQSAHRDQHSDVGELLYQRNRQLVEHSLRLTEFYKEFSVKVTAMTLGVPKEELPHKAGVWMETVGDLLDKYDEAIKPINESHGSFTVFLGELERFGLPYEGLEFVHKSLNDYRNFLNALIVKGALESIERKYAPAERADPSLVVEAKDALSRAATLALEKLNAVAKARDALTRASRATKLVLEKINAAEKDDSGN